MPREGELGLTTMGSWISWWVVLGQALLGDASRYTHAFVVTSETELVEAWSSGARPNELSAYAGHPLLFSALDLTDQQRRDVVAHAKSLEGTPYSFLDYLSLALLHWGIRPGWLTDYVKNSGHMICSQLVDEAFRRAGVHLFTDGRLPQDVTPGALFYVLLGNAVG